MEGFNYNDMGDLFIDHYSVLGVASGEEGARLSFKEISKAYRQKALELHPDKRPDDPKAHDNFQRLKSSYEILNNDAARKLFDDLLRVRRDRQQRDREFDAKRRRMVSDLGERERAAAAAAGGGGASGDAERDPQTLAEERIKKKLKEEIARQRDFMRKGGPKSSKEKTPPTPAATEAATTTPPNTILKVSWERSVSDYTASMLREIFQEFGDVVDVVLRTKKKSSSALVVMSTEEAAFAATGSLCGDLSNPLLVLPSHPTNRAPSVQPHEPVASRLYAVDASSTPLTSYNALEESILAKLRKAAEKQK